MSKPKLYRPKPPESRWSNGGRIKKTEGELALESEFPHDTLTLEEWRRIRSKGDGA